MSIPDLRKLLQDSRRNGTQIAPLEVLDKCIDTWAALAGADTDEDSRKVVKEITPLFTSLVAENLALRVQISELQKLIDKAYPVLVETVCSNITNTGSALQAIGAYDQEWFTSLPFSNEALTVIAQSLSQACRPWVGNIIPMLWTQIANSNFDLLYTEDTDIEAVVKPKPVRMSNVTES
jgi:hypothetical protein